MPTPAAEQTALEHSAGVGGARPPARPAAALLLLAPALLALFGCALLAPAVVNGDGLGYLRAAPTGERVPGHLALLPAYRLLGRLVGQPGSTEGASLASASLRLLGPARAASWLAAALAAALVAAIGRLLLGPAAALVAGLGLVGSWGFLLAGSDVESYAPSLAAMCAALYAAVRRQKGGGAGWAVAAAMAAAMAALLHLENVLFVPTVALIASQRTRRAFTGRGLAEALALAALAAAPVGWAYAIEARARHLGAGATLAWIGGASHGFRYPINLLSPLRAIYGLARTLVPAPYPSEASWTVVLTETAVGLIALAVLGWLIARPGRGPLFGPAATLAWVLPYATVGVLFFASDSERWIFLLPLAWLLAGAGAARSRLGLRVGLGLGAALLALGLALGRPRALDPQRRILADRASAMMAAGDLVISPGHGWDEYVGFYQALPLEHFPMVYFCGLHGHRAMAAELADRAERARRAGRAVWLLRADEPEEREGWKDLVPLGVTPRSLGALLPGRRVPIAPGVERLE